MKRLICCILIFLELFLLTGCKSGDVREVEKSIEGIGTVSVEKEEKIIKTAADIAPGDRIDLRLQGGSASCLVEQVDKA